MKALCIATCSLRENSRGFEDHNPIVEITGKCLYRKGDFSIYKHQERAYYFLWKNVIIGEYGGVNKELADIMANDAIPSEVSMKNQRFLYNLADYNIKRAERYAKLYDFTIL